MNDSLFDLGEPNNWKQEWIDMPEYDNQFQEEPKIKATFKFRNSEDFEEFYRLVKEHLYHGEKVFDGIQTKTVKSAWYPLKEKASNYRYK